MLLAYNVMYYFSRLYQYFPFLATNDSTIEANLLRLPGPSNRHIHISFKQTNQSVFHRSRIGNVFVSNVKLYSRSKVNMKLFISKSFCYSFDLNIHNGGAYI